MKKIVKFFKQDNTWYADIPNHTLEENEMVMCSDFALDILSQGKDELWLTLSTVYDPKSLLNFKLKEHDNEGGYYTVSGILYTEFLNTFMNGKSDFINEIWICNVTHDIFGEHPNNIYLLDIQF